MDERYSSESYCAEAAALQDHVRNGEMSASMANKPMKVHRHEKGNDCRRAAVPRALLRAFGHERKEALFGGCFVIQPLTEWAGGNARGN